MSKIIVNEQGSPVQIHIKQGISKNNKKYMYLEIVIGNDDFPIIQRIFLKSPRDYVYIDQVLNHE